MRCTIYRCFLGLLVLGIGCGDDGKGSDSAGGGSTTPTTTTSPTTVPTTAPTTSPTTAPTTIPDPVGDIVLNEFLTSNSTGLQDETGAFPDWIEIFNRGDAEIDLTGWTLTDDISDPFKWELPDGTVVAAGAYLVVFADSDVADGDLHASFNLDKDGGDVAISDPSGVIDSVTNYAPQETDVSWGRASDGGSPWESQSPTPDASNG
jgi:hypothetical protein